MHQRDCDFNLFDFIQQTVRRAAGSHLNKSAIKFCLIYAKWKICFAHNASTARPFAHKYEA